MGDTIIEQLNSRIVDLEAKGECPLVVAELRDYKRRITALELGLAAAEKRAEKAEAWKESMLSVMPPMQEIGNELGVLLGDSIHDKILSGIKTLKAQLAIFKPCVELYADTKARAWFGRDGCEPAQAALAKVEEMKGGA